MAINVTDLDIGTRGVNNETLPQFAGRDRQIVINVDDSYRPIIMDGQTLGGKSKVALLTDLNDITIDKKDLTVAGENTQILGTGTTGETGLQTRIENKVTDSEASIQLSVRDSSNNTNIFKISTESITFNDKELALQETLQETLDALGSLAEKDEITSAELANVITLNNIQNSPIIFGQVYGTDSEISTYTGNIAAPGQLIWSTDGHALYVMDGLKTGGYKVSMAEYAEANYLKKSEPASSAEKLGASSVGSTNTPIYLNAGSPTALSETIGSTDIPVYLNNGVITSCGKSFLTAEGDQTINGNLTLQGTIFASSFQVSSDIRLKTNLKVLDNSLNIIENLTGYTYNLKDTNVNETQAGLIAQDLINAGFKEAVKPREDGYLTVNYQAVTALLVESVKALSIKIKQLENRLNE